MSLSTKTVVPIVPKTVKSCVTPIYNPNGINITRVKIG